MRRWVVIQVVWYFMASAVIAKETEYRCTIYYTPRESGFTAAGGFDMAPQTKPGLQGKTYARDFLKAVMVEGFGRLAVPHEGKAYVSYDGKRWSFVKQPVGSRDQPLLAKKSCSVWTSEKRLGPRSTFTLDSKVVYAAFKTKRWIVADSGVGIGRHDIDLYWGEDDPRGPGRSILLPKGTGFEEAQSAASNRR